ncbi:hypothetical protein Tco_1504748 [Tanacetum coccineum]
MVLIRAVAPSTYILAPPLETPLSETLLLLPIPLPTSSPPLLMPSTDWSQVYGLLTSGGSDEIAEEIPTLMCQLNIARRDMHPMLARLDLMRLRPELLIRLGKCLQEKLPEPKPPPPLPLPPLSMTDAAIRALISRGVADALA